jgi:hypothetical protein
VSSGEIRYAGNSCNRRTTGGSPLTAYSFADVDLINILTLDGGRDADVTSVCQPRSPLSGGSVVGTDAGDGRFAGSSSYQETTKEDVMSTTVSTRRTVRLGTVVLWVVLWVVQVVTAAMFVSAGLQKLSGNQLMVDMFATVGAGQWLRYVAGAIAGVREAGRAERRRR